MTGRSLSGTNLGCRVRTALAELAGRLSGPLAEGTAEVGQVRVAQLIGDLADGLIGITQQLDGAVFQYRFDNFPVGGVLLRRFRVRDDTQKRSAMASRDGSGPGIMWSMLRMA